MIKKIFSHPYSIVSGIFFGLAFWDFLFYSQKLDVFFLALSVTFACLGIVAQKKHKEKEEKEI